jgi:hypothetical protein
MKTKETSPPSSMRIAAAEAIAGLRGANMRFSEKGRASAIPELEPIANGLRPALQDASAASLSATARMLAGLPGTPPPHSRTSGPGKAAPLVPGYPVDARALRDVLKSALAHSGIFYESHLAQWMSGHRSREEVLREPQARLAWPFPNESHGTGTSAATGTHAPVYPERPVIHPDALPVVQQQLIALDTGHVVWRGEVWKRQTLEWEVWQQQAQQRRADMPLRWQTRLSLDLPRLGRLEAMISFAPAGVHIHLSAANARAADTLDAAVPSLAHGLRRAGLAVSHVEVAHARG